MIVVFGSVRRRVNSGERLAFLGSANSSPVPLVIMRTAQAQCINLGKAIGHSGVWVRLELAVPKTRNNVTMRKARPLRQKRIKTERVRV